MDPLPRIPVGPGAWWRRCRRPLAHGVVFLGSCYLIFLSWQHLRSAAGFVGQAEIVEVTISSRDAGYITNLWVLPLQEIKAGDLVAEVLTTDPRTVNNRLEAMRDRMRLTALEQDPIFRRERSALDYEQFSVEKDRVNTELAIAVVKLDHAIIQLDRDEKGFQQHLVSAEIRDLSRRNKEALEVEVREKSNYVKRVDKTLERLKAMAEMFVPGGESDPIKQALELEEDKMRVFEAKVAPLQLFAPTNGVVTTIHRRAGEQVLPGAPIATITSGQSGRIVGFLPEQFSCKPRIGMSVEVVTRGPHRKVSYANIIGISPHLQPITNSLMAPVTLHHAVIYPMGRVLSISLPPDLDLLPGAPVDLRFVDSPGSK